MDKKPNVRTVQVLSLCAITILALAIAAPLGLAEDASSQPSAASVVGNTNSIYSLQYVHQAMVRLPNGTLCAAFSTNLLGTSSCQVYVTSSSDDGATWGQPAKISTATGMGNQLCNQGTSGCVIAADSDGKVYVAWTGVNDASTYFQVWAARYNGEAWETPVEASQSGGGVQAYYPSIAVDGENNVHLVWQSFPTDNSNDQKIYYSEFVGNWSAPIIISGSLGGSQMYPSIAVDSNNDLHVVWTGGSDYTKGSRQVYYAKFNGAWTAPVMISSRADLSSHYMNAPCIAVDSRGYLHVVWDGVADGPVTHSQIWYTTYQDSWSTPIRISTNPGMNSSDQIYPTIAADTNNNIHAAWSSTLEHAVFYTNYTSVWNVPIQIESTPSSNPVLRWSCFPASNQVSLNMDFVFLKDSTIMFDRGLGSSQSLYTVSVTPTPPVSLVAGQAVMFTAHVTGGVAPYNYAWYLNSTYFSGASQQTWSYIPTAPGTFNVYVKVTDSAGNIKESAITVVQVSASGQPSGYFGNANYSSMAGGSGTLYTATGSKFTLSTEANISSISCCMRTDFFQVPHPASFAYRYGIYGDNGGSIGNLIAQTPQGFLTNDSEQWNRLNFSSPIHLDPGVYWLTEVDNAISKIMIHDALADGFMIVQGVLDDVAFPSAFPSPTYTQGMVTCIFASWGIPTEGNLPPPPPTNTTNPTNSSSPSASPNASAIPSSPPLSNPQNTTAVLDVSCKGSTSLSDFSVQIFGHLARGNGENVPNAAILISYSNDGGSTWQALTTADTDTNGNFLVFWQPSVTGNYQIKAAWAGDAASEGVTNVVKFDLQPAAENTVFSVSSNSTLTGLAFDSAARVLSFTVEGTSGTAGYVDVYVPKSLLSDASNLTVRLDDSVLPYWVQSQGDSWLISFSYHHSSHNVVVTLGTSHASPSAGAASTAIEPWIIAVAVTIAAVIVAAGVAFGKLCNSYRKARAKAE